MGESSPKLPSRGTTTRVFRLTSNETNIFLLRLGDTTISIRSSLVVLSIIKGLVDFRKFDNFRHFFRNNSANNYRSDVPMNGKDASH